MNKVVTVADLPNQRGTSEKIVLKKGQKLTAAALELIKERKWQIIWELEYEHEPGYEHEHEHEHEYEGEHEHEYEDEYGNDVVDEEYLCSGSACGGLHNGGCCQTKDLEKSMVQKKSLLGLQLDRFDCGVPGADVSLRDVIAGRDNPNLAAGLMSFRSGAKFPWHLDYDEIDLVLKGVLTIETGGQLIEAKAGEVVSIPHGTSLIFGTPDECLVYYVTYPANWNE